MARRCGCTPADHSPTQTTTHTRCFAFPLDNDVVARHFPETRPILIRNTKYSLITFHLISSMPCHAAQPSIQGEGSKHQIWNTFGWIYDTSVAMVHIALAGVFRRYPGVTLAAAKQPPCMLGCAYVLIRHDADLGGVGLAGLVHQHHLAMLLSLLLLLGLSPNNPSSSTALLHLSTVPCTYRILRVFCAKERKCLEVFAPVLEFKEPPR